MDKRVTVGTPGIYKTKDPETHTLRNDATAAEKAKVADLSYSNDVLAQMIVDAWLDPAFHQGLLNPATAKKELARRGLYLTNPIVIDEKDYFEGFPSISDEMIFVVPDKNRVDMTNGGLALLDTARLLMACTPHGI